MYHTILFDLDGTLTDPKEGITKCVQYSLKHFDIEEEDLDQLEHFIGPPLMEQFMECYGFDQRTAELAVEKYRERYSKIGILENQIYPGIKKLLEELKYAGKVISLASSKPTVYCKEIVERFGIADYFQVIVGSELDGRRTNKAEVIEEALNCLQIKEEEKYNVIMVGDRSHDIIGAKKNGLTTIGVKIGYAKEGELEEAGADYIVESIDKLHELLFKIMK
ncbi:HAD family hydrolase [Anaerosacchariphilus polymeriproducens]|uniref:HAD family hydrolase n=1 Tax=Anaerosacchariphilus polymeriproducens TaxID=1812858 RepID=A0A371AWS4_9FIRM|nr:HAD family hydrolase [Anaerosacchariphilus polymeriproducens]RDU23972.1 HAD family hydrolase [Anaerosacchariphilus polymeriproducens]